MMTVCKFGGSSVADAAQIKKVKAILDADENRSIVIVSAPGKRNREDEKITDLLYKCNEAVQKGGSCKEIFAIIQERFISIADELKIEKKPLIMQLEEIRQLIDAGRGADYAASRGEYLSAFLFSQYLNFEFIDAADSIVINSDGTVNPFSYDKIHMLVDNSKKKKFVFPGFYGSTKDGVIKTFTRGGSDITGSVVSRAVNADVYENWTDVSGFLSADPRIVEDARVIDTISYNEVRELSDYGASVFHEEAIAPVVKSGIPINIKNTNRPEDRGTLIMPTCEEKKLAGVSAKGGLSRIKIRKLMLFKKQGMRHALLTMLHIFGIRPSFSLFGIDSIVWFYDTKMASESILDAMCERLKSEFELDEVSVDSGHAILGVVGSSIADDGSYIKAAKALSDASIPVSFLNYGASDVSYSFGIRDEDKEKAVKTVYDALFK